MAGSTGPADVIGGRCGREGNVRIVILVAVAVVVVVAGVILFRRSSEAASLEQAQSAAVRFLEELQSGQIDAAWEGTTAEFKSFIGRDRLRRMVDETPELQEPCELLECREADVEQLTLLECLFRSTVTSETTVRVLLGNERGEWKVERLYVGPPNGS
jgi:hypothetical protein